jgi:phosphate starvation-inducible protein PhoH
MARKGRITSTSNVTKKTALSGRRVSKKNKINDVEITESIKKNTFLDFNIQQKYVLTPVHDNFLETCFKEACKISLIDGPAGSAKTYLSVYIALQLLRTHKIDEIIYIRSVVESASKSMGSLPGEVEEKFLPWSLPLMEKLNELIDKPTITNLMSDNFIKCVPVNYTRGLTFKNACVIVDEAQNLTKEELTTILTRFGQESKYMVVGDTRQSDIGNKTGFKSIYNAFTTEESIKHGIFGFEFTELEIVRSELLKYIVKVLDKLKMKS